MTIFVLGPSAMESPTAHNDEDISARMMRRAKCSQSARYSMDAALNIHMLTEEEKDGSDGVDESNRMLPESQTLIRLWSWIKRIETLCSHNGATDQWPAKGLADSGVWRLLQLDKIQNGDTSVDDVVAYDEFLSCNTYASPWRR
jgi:hypothetical protein